MKTLSTLSVKYAEQFPELFALELQDCSVEETADVLNTLPDANVLAVMTHLQSTQLHGVVAGNLLTSKQLFSQSTLDQAAILLARLPKDLALVLVNSVTDKAKQRELRRYLNYPAHSVGAVVSKPSLQYKNTDPVRAVIADLAKLEDQTEPTILVVDASGKYLGVVEAWRLFPAMTSDQTIASLTGEVEPLLAEIDQVTAMANPLWNSRSWLPVVDYQLRLIGICRQVHLAQELPLTEPSPPHVLTSSVQAMVGQMFHILLSLFDLLLNRSKQ